MRKLFTIFLIIILVSEVSPMYSAVSSPYQIYGVVIDSTGNPAYSVRVNITDVSQGSYLLVYTDKDGKYSADLSEMGSYGDGDAINVTATTVRIFSGTRYEITGYGEGAVDTDNAATKIDITLNLSLSVLSGSVMDFLDRPVDSIYFNLTDMNTAENFSDHLVNLEGDYQVPLCVLPSLSPGDTLSIEAVNQSFSCSTSFLFSGGLSVIRNITLADDTLPTVHFLYPDDGSSSSMDSDITFYARITDDDMVSSVTLYYSRDGYFEQATMLSEPNSSMDWNENGTIDQDIFGFIMNAQGSPCNISFYISAVDRAGNTVYFPEVPYIIHLNDTTPPVIEHTAPQSREAALSFALYAEVQDNWKVEAVWLNYTDTLSTVHNVSMASSGNGTFTALVAGQPVGVMAYSISATDGRNWNSTGVYTLSIVDTLPPEIEHNPLNSMNVGSSAPLLFKIDDISGVYNATLHYMGVNDSSFRDIPLSASGDNFTASIPPQNFTGELHYFITCDDGRNAARFPQTGNITVSVLDAGTPLITSVHSGPVDVGSAFNITAVIADDVGVSSATLYYNLSGSSEIHTLPMSIILGDARNGTWFASFPAQSSPVIVWYRINATDGVNNITYPYASIERLEILDLSPPQIISLALPTSANISSPFSLSLTLADNYMISSATMVEVSDNSTWFIRHPMHLEDGNASCGRWNLSLSYNYIGRIRFFFEVSDGEHTVRYPETGYLSLDILDNIPPVVLDLKARPSSHHLPAVVGDRLVVEAYLTDNVEVKNATLYYLFNGRLQNVSMIYVGSNVFYALSAPLSVPGEFLYYITVSDGFTTVRSPDSSFASITIMDPLPPEILNNIPQRVEAGHSAFISGRVTDDFNISSLTAHYRFVSDDGEAGEWRNFSVFMYHSLSINSSVSCNFSLFLPSFFTTGVIEFNLSASDGYNTAYSPSGSAFSIQVVDTTPPSVHIVPTAAVYGGNESRVYVLASDLSGITSVVMETSTGRRYRAEYIGSDASGNGTYLFRITSRSDVLYRLKVTDGRYNTLETPDSGYYLVRFSSPPSMPAAEPSSAERFVLNILSLSLISLQALGLSLILLRRKLI